MDPELFQRMQEAAERFRTGASDREEIMTPNGLAVIERDDAEPMGFSIRFVGDGAKRSVRIQEYPAAPSRPPGYPAPLPFLPGCISVVDTAEQAVTWYDPEDADAAFEEVGRQCVDDGWTRRRVLPVAGAAETRVFEKDGVERVLSRAVSPGEVRIVLTERRPGA